MPQSFCEFVLLLYGIFAAYFGQKQVCRMILPVLVTHTNPFGSVGVDSPTHHRKVRLLHGMYHPINHLLSVHLFHLCHKPQHHRFPDIPQVYHQNPARWNSWIRVFPSLFLAVHHRV